MYQMQTEIPFTSVGGDGKLKLHQALSMMMDCCQFQEYQEKNFCEFLRSNNIAVFLYSVQLDIIRLPEFRENVTTQVKIYDCKSIYGLRRITMRDQKGDLCIISNATGAFFDLNALKAVKLDPAVFQVNFDEAEPMECLPRKIPIIDGETVHAPDFVVKPSNLDFNGHLTSAIYLAIATDSLKDDFAFNRVRIEYKKQAKPGDIIHPSVHYNGSAAVVDMRGDDGISFAVTEFSNADFSEYNL